MCFSAVLGVGSALIGASSASKAAKAQTAAADRQAEVQRETRDLIRSDLSPYRGAGDNALAALQYELGLGARPTFGGSPLEITEIPGATTQNARGGRWEWQGKTDGGREVWVPGPSTTTSPARYSVGGQVFDTREQAEAYANANPTGGTEYGGFQKTPGYDFRLQQGMDTVEASRAGQSGLVSGRTLRDLTQYGQDYASGEYNNYLNRLAGFTDMGLSAAQMAGAASQNAAAGMSQAYGNAGNAAAAGAIGVGNAIQGGIQNGLGLWQYQNSLKPPATAAYAPATSPRPMANPFY